MSNNQKRHFCLAAANARTVMPALVLLIGATPAFAGAGAGAGAITFSSVSVTAVPTMGSVALILLSGLLAVIAMKSYRKAGGITPAIVGALGIAALTSAGGVQLIQDVRALPSSVEVDVDGPGERPLIDGINTFRNTSGAELQVEDLELNDSCRVVPELTEGPVCNEGGIVSDGDQCSVETECIIADIT